MLGTGTDVMGDVSTGQALPSQSLPLLLGACGGTCAGRRVLGAFLEDAGGFHGGHQWLQWCCPPSQPW